jgi:NAD+ kinase
MTADASAAGLGSVALVVRQDRELAQELAANAEKWLTAHGVEVRWMTDEATAPPSPIPLERKRELLDGVDLAISLGGDGTMLHAVDLVYECGLPVLGVNVGRLGYLAEVEPAGVEDALGRLVAGSYEIDERMMLEVAVSSSGPARGTWWALNEAVLEKERLGRLVRLDVVINGGYFTTYAADGVIVSTPTGSTAYSFSARGPLVSPRHGCMVLTPISPHMLFDRALVLGEEEELSIMVAEARPVVLTVDGREIGELVPGDTISCTGASQPARIVTFRPRDFHQILKAKFGLADR